MSVPTSQQQLLSQDPQNWKRRYAVAFNEGSGYLLVDTFVTGANAATMLVKSQQTGEICVRRICDLIRASATEHPFPAEVINAVDHSHIAKLLAHRTYPDPRPPHLGQFLNYTSVWQLCNGGQIHSVFSRQNRRQARVPEAVLWNFIRNGLDSILAYTQRGIAHTDLHQGNVVLDWPSGSPLPELYLIDFGGSVNYPTIQNEQFKRPWTGTLDQALIHNGTLTNDEYGRLDRWYGLVMRDLKFIRSHIQRLLFQQDDRPLRATGRVSDQERHFFTALARSNSGFNGYTPQLIKVFAAWSNILAIGDHEFEMCYDELQTLLHHVKQFAVPYCHNFLTSGDRAFQSTFWMRTTMPIANKTYVVKNPSKLLNPRPPKYDDKMTDSNAYADGGRLEDDDDDPDANLRIILQLTGELKLRQGQYHVVEIMFNNTTGDWYPVKVVNSIDDVGLPLSPEPPIQNGWNPYIGDGANPFPHFDTIVTNRNDPSYPWRTGPRQAGANQSRDVDVSNLIDVHSFNPDLTQDQLQTMSHVLPLPDTEWLVLTSQLELDETMLPGYQEEELPDDEDGWVPGMPAY